MSEATNSATTILSTDEQADKRVLKHIAICILVMMGVAVAIVTTANSIA